MNSNCTTTRNISNFDIANVSLTNKRVGKLVQKSAAKSSVKKSKSSAIPNKTMSAIEVVKTKLYDRKIRRDTKYAQLKIEAHEAAYNLFLSELVNPKKKISKNK